MGDSFLNVTLLAILQGIAEFLPISSSGHLVIGQKILGFNQPGIRLDLALHVGTLLSIFVFYRNILKRIVCKFEVVYVLKIVVSAIPAALAYFFLKEELMAHFKDVRLIGMLLVLTGIILLGTRLMPRGKKSVTFASAFFMGLGQALAVLPGLSRSGMTLACARASQVDPEKSAEFSFLMSAPLILGGMILEIIDDISSTIPSVAFDDVSWPLVSYGAVISAIVGYFSLAVLLKILKGKNFWMFGIYCVTVGVLTLIYLR